MTTPESSAAAMERLTSNHRRFLNFLTARVGSPQDAEEILQDAFVRSVQKAGEIRDDERVVAWFYRLLRNAITDHFRRKAAGERALAAKAAESMDDGVDAELERTVCACVDGLIPGLKPEYEAMLRRADLEGASVAAVAAELGISEGNARVRLHRARAALRSELERSCRTCATHGCLDCSCAPKGM